MSSHHGHHRSHHSRSRMHHNSSSSHYSSMQNRSRTSSSNAINDTGGSGASIPSHRGTHPEKNRDSNPPTDWQEHKSSSGKVYYYNPRSGVSQWEVPAELRQQRPVSPESELSESSSIRQQQENSPSSSASSHHSVQSDTIAEDKPLLTPSLADYYKPDLIVNFNSSQRDELEQHSAQLLRETLLLSERLLEERVELILCKMRLEHTNTQVEAHETRCTALRKTIEKFGIPNYQ